MELINTHPIKKSDLGFHGNLFGGKLMAWIDASANNNSKVPFDLSSEKLRIPIAGISKSNSIGESSKKGLKSANPLLSK